MTIYIECMEKRRKKRAPFVCLLTEKFMDPDGIEETQFHLIHCKIIQAPLPNRSPFDYAKRIGLSCIPTKFLRIKQNFSRCCSVFFLRTARKFHGILVSISWNCGCKSWNGVCCADSQWQEEPRKYVYFKLVPFGNWNVFYCNWYSSRTTI